MHQYRGNVLYLKNLIHSNMQSHEKKSILRLCTDIAYVTIGIFLIPHVSVPLYG